MFCGAAKTPVRRTCCACARVACVGVIRRNPRALKQNRQTCRRSSPKVDPDGFYGEAELLNLYAAVFPAPGGAQADRREVRIRRLRKRQAAVLARLEATLAEALQPGHTRDTWFEPALGQRLGAARLVMLADLPALIGSYGRRWRNCSTKYSTNWSSGFACAVHTCPRTSWTLGDLIADR
jgi:hypothetical protein